MRVLIIGAGIGGLCLANGLRKAGIEAHVYERQTSQSENLAGYGIHIDHNGKHALRRCIPVTHWARFQDEVTSAGTQMFFRDSSLRLLAERDDAKVSGKPASAVERSGIGRLELQDILLDGLIDAETPLVHWDKKFTHFDHIDGGRVRAHFADGTSEEGDVLVGADGSQSRVRKQLLPEVERLELGITAIAGRCVLNEQRCQDLPVEITNGSLNNIVPHGKGWMFVSAWQFRPPSDTVWRSQTERYVVWAYVVPYEEASPDVSAVEPVGLQNLVLEAIESWSPQLQAVVRESDASTIKAIPLRSMPFLQPWKTTNVTLLGDAIHNMTPMGGVGANTALRDAESLTRMLVSAVSGITSCLDAIAVYESEMREYANEAVGLCRRNAENASRRTGIQRWMFRALLRVAHASPTIMRVTLGRSVVKAH